jgi:hypothetical protein
MMGIAVKAGQDREKGPPDYTTMGTVTCDTCKAQLIIGHHPALKDQKVAEKQAKVLEEMLAEDHRLNREHKDAIDLKWP